MFKNEIKSYFIKSFLRKQLPISLDRKNNVSFMNIKPLFLDKVFCVLNFDDLSLIPDKSDFIGRGGGLYDFVTIKHLELLEHFPFLGITHFMVPQFIPADYYYLYNKIKYSITNQEHEKWISFYKSLKDKFNIEYSSHGLYHRQSENLLFSRHTEFAYLNYNQALRRINESIDLFREVGIFPIGFRPPGWDMNTDLSLMDAIFASGLKYACLSSYDGGLNAMNQRISFYHPTFVKGIVNFPDNINIDWSFEDIKMTIKKIVQLNGIISIKGHFSKHILPNSFSEVNYYKLVHVIEFIKAEYGHLIEFGTFKDVYEKLVESGQIQNKRSFKC